MRRRRGCKNRRKKTNTILHQSKRLMTCQRAPSSFDTFLMTVGLTTVSHQCRGANSHLTPTFNHWHLKFRIAQQESTKRSAYHTVATQGLNHLPLVNLRSSCSIRPQCLSMNNVFLRILLGIEEDYYACPQPWTPGDERAVLLDLYCRGERILERKVWLFVCPIL